MPRALCTALLFAAVWAAGADALAQNATDAGTGSANISTPHPTVRALSIEWAIAGDDDQDAAVTVRYRPLGGGTWLLGMPLRRVPAGSNQGFTWTNKHSGSLFDLIPDTTYEVELSLTDPDGGSSTQTIQASTRPIPTAPLGATEIPVTPGTFATAAGGAGPGDILLLAAGNYAGFTFAQDGDPQNPIIIRSETPGDAIVGGDVRLDGRSDVWLEGLTVNGKIKFNNAFRIVIRNCVINTSEGGIISYANGVEDAYICDNVVMGQGAWALDQLGASGFNGGEGIELTGPGNVICHNYVEGFRDAISTMEDSSASNQTSIDIYGNDINIATDDGIEADFTMGNVRVVGNRITNAFIGLSGQPTLGGPLYFIRNVQYNSFNLAFKLYRGSVGDVVLHNTTVKYGDAFGLQPGVAWSRAWFRNNIFIGGHSGTNYASTNGGYGTGDGDVADVNDAVISGPDACSFDFDGYGAVGVPFGGHIGGDSFTDLATLRANTTEANAQEVGLSIFAAGVTFPDPPVPSRPVPDLRLASGNDAIDTGVPIANINDGFSGTAPDLGAYELGAELPVYGPRVSIPIPTYDGGPSADGEPSADGGPDGGSLPGDTGMPAGDGDPGAGGGDGSGTPAGDTTVPGDASGSSLEGGCTCRGNQAQLLPLMAAVLVAFVRRRTDRG